MKHTFMNIALMKHTLMKHTFMNFALGLPTRAHRWP